MSKDLRANLLIVFSPFGSFHCKFAYIHMIGIYRDFPLEDMIDSGGVRLNDLEDELVYKLSDLTGI